VGIGPFKGVRAKLNAHYVGERVGGHIITPTTFVPMGVEYLPSYTVVGANLSYDAPARGPLAQLSFQLNVDNLFDRHYIGAVSSSTATQPEFGLLTGPAVRTLDRYFIGAPRTVTFSARARF
jgi:outer membrane receptor protein involved in Fe transport